MMRWSTNILKGLIALASTISAQDNCKCFPGDTCWPSTDDWDSLNTTVGGQLIATVPLGEPCHAPTYNARECQALKREWQLVDVQYRPPDPPNNFVDTDEWIMAA
jgi:hypothetical protein